MLHYRKAAPEDIDTLTGLRVLMLSESTGLTESYREILAENTRQYLTEGLKSRTYAAFVAVKNDRIVAMSGLTFYTLPPNEWCPGGKTAYIGGLYTLLEYRRQGIAARLLSLTVEEAKKTGCERVQLHTTDMGRPMYEKYGFEYSPSSMAYFPFGKKNEIR